MFKKTSDTLEKCIVFSINFPSIFCEKSMNNRAGSLKNGIAYKNPQKSRLGPPFFRKKLIFDRFLGILWVPGDLPGRPRNLAFFIFRRRGGVLPRWPASQPTSQPTNQPANQPTNQPANQPANQTTTHFLNGINYSLKGLLLIRGVVIQIDLPSI